MGHVGYISSTKVRRRNKDRHTEQGLCRMCSRKTNEGRLHCEYHLNLAKEYKKKRGGKR